MKNFLVLALATSAISAYAACPEANLQKAQEYKALIGNAQAVSESDEPWKVFCSDVPAVDMSEASLAIALRAGRTHMRIYTPEEAVEYLDWYISENDPPEEAIQYAQLKAALLRDFTEIYAVKVGEEDTVQKKFYLFGRTADGYLVGLKTILVET